MYCPPPASLDRSDPLGVARCRHRRPRTAERTQSGRCPGVIAQRLPKFADRHAETAVKIHERIVRPEAASKVLAADDFSGSFEKHEEELIGLLLHPYGSPVLQEFARGGVYLKRAELIDGSWMCLHIWAPQAEEDR